MIISGAYYIIRWNFPKESAHVNHSDWHDSRFGIEDEALAFYRLLKNAGAPRILLFHVKYQEQKTENFEICLSEGIHEEDKQYYRPNCP